MDRGYGSFVWNIEKERINIAKHGVDFEIASRVSLDLKRRYLRTKSTAEQRSGFTASAMWMAGF